MKKSVKCVLFLSIGACIYYIICGVLIDKGYETSHLDYLYNDARKNSIDVVFLGNSHVYCSVIPAVLWQEQGIASLVMSSGAQPAYSTYFRLIEVLKTQQPKLIVIGMNGLVRELGQQKGYKLNRVNSLGWRLSPNFVNMLGEAFGSSDLSVYFDFILGLPVYHYRYENITRNDFRQDRLTYGKGFRPNTRIFSINKPQALPESDIEALHPAGEMYLKKILECAQAAKIDLLFLATPHDYLSVEEQKKYNYIASIVSTSYSLLNYFPLFDEVGFDVKNEFFDKQHLNNKGAIRLSKHLATYLKKHYDLPNRKKDALYDDWGDWAERMVKSYVSSFNKANPKQKIG